MTERAVADSEPQMYLFGAPGEETSNAIVALRRAGITNYEIISSAGKHPIFEDRSSGTPRSYEGLSAIQSFIQQRQELRRTG